MPTLNQTLGELPSGGVQELSDAQLGSFIRDNYTHNPKLKEKRNKLCKRLDFFHDRSDKHIEKMVDGVFENQDVAKEHKKFIAHATYQNVTRRVVEELSTVYSEAADRNATPEKNYTELQRVIRMNTRMRQANEYVNLLNQCLLWFTIREVEGQDSVPELRVFTPDTYFAVSHPLDPLRHVATILPLKRAGFKEDQSLPAWIVWDDHETFLMNGHGHVLTPTRKAHDLVRMPGVLVHRKMPTEAITDYDSGDDIIAAHEAVTLLNILLLRGEKMGVRIPFIAGDISRTATGQRLDGESLVQFQDGVAPGTLDLRADPTSLINSARFIIKQIAANHGIPESVFDLSYQATSGFEIELKRTGLREKRHQQIMDPWHPAERDLAEVMAEGTDGDDRYSFSTTNWNIDFGEFDTPREPLQRLAIWEKREGMGLMSKVDMVMKENPEFSRAQAVKRLEQVMEDKEQLQVARDVHGLQPPMVQAQDTTAPDDEEDEEDGPPSQPRNGPPPPLQ